MSDPWKHRSSGMKCSTCMWYAEKRDLSPATNPLRPEVGRCRRHAPSMNGYPVVYPTDWCGDHKLDETKVFPAPVMMDPESVEKIKEHLREHDAAAPKSVKWSPPSHLDEHEARSPFGVPTIEQEQRIRDGWKVERAVRVHEEKLSRANMAACKNETHLQDKDGDVALYCHRPVGHTGMHEAEYPPKQSEDDVSTLELWS